MATLPQSLDSLKGKSVAASLRSGETCGKPLDGDWRRLVGRAIERALVLANLTKQEASHAMGYADQSKLSRWIAGDDTAPPQFHKLLSIESLRPWIPVALAEVCASDECDVETTVRVWRRAPRQRRAG